MCTPQQWHLRATPRYEVLKQRMGAASAAGELVSRKRYVIVTNVTSFKNMTQPNAFAPRPKPG